MSTMSFSDLGRMYNLVKLIPDGLGELRNLLEKHICNQGHNAIEKCGDEALNVCVLWFYITFCIYKQLFMTCFVYSRILNYMWKLFCQFIVNIMH